MSLTWRILLVSLLLNLLTVGVVQVVVYLSQEAWFRRERNALLEPVLDSLSLLERVYSPARIGSARQVLVLVAGAGKRDAVARWRSGEPVPISHIRPAAGLTVMLTADAWTS